MTRSDHATRRITTCIVAAVALFAAGDSYSHIYDLARQHGQGVASAALLPLAGDGLIAAASSAMLAAARAQRPVPLRARILLLLGIGATIAANVAYGLPDGLTGALLSVWPVAAYVGCVEILSWMQEHLGTTRSASARKTAVAPADAGSAKPDAPPRKPRTPVPDLLRTAEVRFPDTAAGGKIPPLRVIQGELGVGQPRAQQIQRHLLSLQATA
jgi:uncharacterized protein DUF2637